MTLSFIPDIHETLNFIPEIHDVLSFIPDIHDTLGFLAVLNYCVNNLCGLVSFEGLNYSIRSVTTASTEANTMSVETIEDLQRCMWFLRVYLYIK
jgi:hypothetical protein